MKRQHKHAAWIHAWADGGEVQYFDNYVGEWILIGSTHCFADDNIYRFKPRMIRCGDLEFPEPMQVAPEAGTKYWAICTTAYPDAVICGMWADSVINRCFLQRGFYHATKEAAEAHANALIALTDVK